MIRTLTCLLAITATAMLSGVGGTSTASANANRKSHTTTEAAQATSLASEWTGGSAYRLVQYWRDRREPYEERSGISYRELERMAYDLQDSASRAHDHAREMFHAKDFQGSRKGADEALAAYKDLKDSSRAFYDQVVKYRGDLGHIDEEYRRVARDYYQARDRSTHYGFHVEANLDRVGRLIEEMRFIERR
jgi:hypothetical protein